MKKLLLIALVLLGICTVMIAQDRAKTEVVATTPKTDTIASTVITNDVTIESVSADIEQLEKKIDRVNKRMQELQNQSSLRWLFRDLIPIFILLIIGVFIVSFVYILTTNNYRNNILKYDTLIKCTEKTGTIPDFFNKPEQQKPSSVPTYGKVNLIIAILCGIISVISFIAGFNVYGFSIVLAIVGTAIFAVVALILLKKYNQINENSRKEQ